MSPLTFIVTISCTNFKLWETHFGTMFVVVIAIKDTNSKTYLSLIQPPWARGECCRLFGTWTSGLNREGGLIIIIG